MKIIVNDANILIDLVELKLLPHFFALEFEFLTTDLVFNELLQEQQDSLSPYIDNGSLQVQELDAEDLIEIAVIQTTKPQLSEQDCSAFYQAMKNTAALITSDNILRKFAKAQEMEVYGHLWVFDCMVRRGAISKARACEKLTELCEVVNPKLGLPKAECTKRIKLWSNI